MFNHFCILLFFIILLVVMDLLRAYEKFDYSDINEDISQGNPLSWSGYLNPHQPTQYEICKFNTNLPHTDQTVIQGHGIPLSYEEKTSNVIDGSMFYFNRHHVSPNCCPSLYFNDQGCVCRKHSNIY